MKRILLFASATLLLGISTSAHSQVLPRLSQGEDYRQARSKLLDSGWQKVKRYEGATDPCKMANSARVCYLYPEYNDSSSDGFCRFLWSNIDGKRLAIASYPCIDSDPGKVTGWGWE